MLLYEILKQYIVCLLDTGKSFVAELALYFQQIVAYYLIYLVDIRQNSVQLLYKRFLLRHFGKYLFYLKTGEFSQRHFHYRLTLNVRKAKALDKRGLGVCNRLA